MNPRAIIIGSTVIAFIVICSIVINQDVKKFLNYDTKNEKMNN
jgi:hypothetical protein